MSNILSTALSWFMLVEHELLLFALAGLLIGGLDDIIIDLIFLVRHLHRKFFVYSRHDRMTGATLPPADNPGRIAIFVPAWREANVIGPMLRNCLNSWGGDDICIFVGTYPNDPETIRAVASVAQENEKIRLVILPHDGGTTKADCLNHIWAAMVEEEKAQAHRFKAIVLHDAEDVVHPDEIRLFDTMIERFDMVQIPVKPLLSKRSRWIAGHYADEFSESHGKFLILREALGAAVPSAGVGCCFARQALEGIAIDRNGPPFDSSSLTEDYEIGLRIAEGHGRTAFIAMNDAAGNPICTQEHFPETLDAAIKQKARWYVGIALAGWDRVGWHGSWRERWMRLHDRRAALSVLVLFAAYCAFLGYGIALIGEIFLSTPLMQPTSTLTDIALTITFGLMIWRLLSRAYWSGRSYGWRQGLLALPRVFVGNIISMVAMHRAIWLYIRQLREGTVIWEKTTHQFPTEPIQIMHQSGTSLRPVFLPDRL